MTDMGKTLEDIKTGIVTSALVTAISSIRRPRGVAASFVVVLCAGILHYSAPDPGSVRGVVWWIGS